MTSFRPAVPEERWLLARDRFGATVAPDSMTGGWRTTRLLSRVAFFFLGIIAVGAFWGVIGVGSDSWRTGAFVAGAAAVLVAEILIIRNRFFQSGIEEALHSCGLALLIAACVPNGADDPVIACAITAACLLIGFRLLNPLFVASAACVFSFAFRPTTTGSLVALGYWMATFVVWFALTRKWKRPSHEMMLALLAVALPVMAWLWSHNFDFDVTRYVFRNPSLEDLGHDATPLVLAAGIAVAAWLGIRHRLHALLLAAMVCTGMLAFDLRQLTGMTMEVRFVVWGSVTLIAAIVIERRLRTRTSDLTSAKLDDVHADSIALLELVGTAVLTASQQQPLPPESPQLDPGGGGFGGAGASGTF